MKAYCLPILCGLLLSVLAQAQSPEWAPIGAAWHYGWTITENTTIQYQRLEVTGDTLIQGEIFRQIESLNIGVAGDTSYSNLYTFARNDSIFQYSPELDTFGLLFYNGLDMGDSIEILTLEPFIANEDIRASVVFIVDTILPIPVNDTVFQLYRLSSLYGDEFFFVKHIGKFTGYLPPFGPDYCCITPLEVPVLQLRCYDSGNELFPFSSDACDQLTGTREAAHALPLGLYPNPAVDFIHLDQPDLPIGASYQLWGGDGRLVAEGVLETLPARIQLAGLRPGLFYLYIRYKSSHWGGRFIKCN